MKANRMTLKGALGRIRMHHIREMSREVPEAHEAPEAAHGEACAPGADEDLVVRLEGDEDDEAKLN